MQSDDVEELLPEDPPIETTPLPPSESMKPDEEGEGGGKDNGDNRKENTGDRKEYRARNCNDCNRQFCLDYNLPICKGAGMEDVATTCFRKWKGGCLHAYVDGEREEEEFGLILWVSTERDSRKDEAVVLIFIFATAGLLIWAAVKPWVGKWVEVR